MAIFIILIFSASALIFVWEAILAPSIRLNLRYKMFAERDRLRLIYPCRNDGSNSKVHEYAHDSVNAGIRAVHQFNVFTLVGAHIAIKKDAGLRDRIARRESLFDACQDQQVKDIMNRAANLVGIAIIVNSAGFLLVFIIPVVAVVACAQFFHAMIVRLLLTPMHELERISRQSFGVGHVIAAG